MYEKLKRRPRNDAALKEPHQETEDEEDDDDEEEDGEKMEVETLSQNDGPMVDEDGFQLVQGKGRRKGK